MKKVTGVVHSEAREDAGRLAFMFLQESGTLVPCISGPGYKSPKPGQSSNVIMTGDTIFDPMKQGDAEDFVYNSLEIVQPAVAEETDRKTAHHLCG